MQSTGLVRKGPVADVAVLHSQFPILNSRVGVRNRPLGGARHKRAAESVTISLGRPITSPTLIPVTNDSLPTRCINKPFMVGGKAHHLIAVSFGSPHGVVFVDDVERVDVQELGFSLGTHALFPKGASVVFAQKVDETNFAARLWELGEGEKSFTSQAACAAAIAAMMTQKTIHDKVSIMMGGESYRVAWDRGRDDVSITGALRLKQ